MPGDEAAVCFYVNVEGTRKYTAYNMDIILPQGVSVATNANGSLRLSLVKGASGIYPYTEIYDEDEDEYTKEYTHTISSVLQSDGNVRVACTSNMNEDFTATSGKLFRVYVQASPYAKPGENEVRLTGLNLTTAENAQKYIPEGNLNTGTLTVDSAVSIPLTIKAENQYGTCFLPFALHTLPEGVEVETALARTAADKKFAAGAIRFVLLRRLGEPVISEAITAEDMREALEWLRK